MTNHSIQKLTYSVFKYLSYKNGGKQIEKKNKASNPRMTA